MAIQGNAGKVEVVKSSIKLYTGIVPVKVIAINPNKQQLIDMGVQAQKEPEYLNEDKVRVDIWCETVVEKTPKSTAEEVQLSEHPIKVKFSTFLRNAARESQKKDKFEWINSFGVTAWGAGDDAPTFQWFKPNGARKAYEGEAQLVAFLRAWVNAGENDEVSLDTWDNIFRGNVKELRDLVAQYKDNILRTMMAVRVSKDGKAFHEIYPYHFERWNRPSFTSWQKHFADQASTNKYVWSYSISEYTPKEPTPDTDATPTEDESSAAWS